MADRSQLSGDREGTTIIGVDCAAQPNNTGIARGAIEGGRLSILNVERGDRRRTPAVVLREWLGAVSVRPTLLALDAPLGWPVAMGRALNSHRAGLPIDVHPDCMFRRITDRFVKKHTRKTPLEVGANLIARTAHSALGLLNCLREATNEEIPLKWCLSPWTGIQAIEVYPALTLRAQGIEVKGYKKGTSEGRTARASIVDKMRTHIEFNSGVGNQMKDSDDLVDAVICAQAGFDFLRGLCLNPPKDEMDTVIREGWIWFRQASPDGRG